MSASRRVQSLSVGSIHVRQTWTRNRQVVQILKREKTSAQSVIQIVMIVSNVIGQRRHLRLHTRVGVEFQIMQGDVFGQRIGHRFRDRAIVLGNALQTFPGQVQTIKHGVFRLQSRDQPDGLRVVIEAAKWRHCGVKRILARMSEWRMSKIVGKRHGLCQILHSARAHEPRCARPAPPQSSASAASGNSRLHVPQRPASCA